MQECEPVGVFLAAEAVKGSLRVRLHYVIPGYRDLRVGRYLFLEQAGFFRERDIQEIVATPGTKDFEAYLLAVGFEPAEGVGEFRLSYDPAVTES